MITEIKNIEPNYCSENKELPAQKPILEFDSFSRNCAKPENGSHLKEHAEAWGFKGKLTCKEDGKVYYFVENWLHFNFMPKFLRFIPPLVYQQSMFTDVENNKFHGTQMIEPPIPFLTKMGKGDKLHEKITYLRPDDLKSFGEKAEIEEQKDGSFVFHTPICEGGELDLTMKPLTAPYHLGENGTMPVGKGGSLTGYTWPRLKAEGELVINGQKKKVEGEVFGEHFWGEWDLFGSYKKLNWFEVNLEKTNNHEKLNLLVYDFRGSKGEQINPTVSIMYENGKQEALHDFEVKPLKFWESPKTHNKYPIEWEINIPSRNISLNAKAVIPNQELYDLGKVRICWFGGLDVEGKINEDKLKGETVAFLVSGPTYSDKK